MRKLVLALAGLGIVAAAISWGAADRFALRDRGPEQPIAFSHELHAGRYEIACLYCHRRADRSPVAGVPSVRTCLDCHRGLSGSASEQEQILAAWKNQEAIAWVRVNDLPDHVYFSHERHVQVGVSCSMCHGAVETMDQVRPVESFTMGFCVGCHRESRLQTTGDGVRAVVPAADGRGEIERRPSIDCATCHQ